ncbi:MAG: hypothetical protein ACSLFQ_03660 [Thermoanaerobaculia bacterium]
MDDELICPTCKSSLEEEPPRCKDEKDRCDCDRVYRCETCEKRWYVSCHRHDYGDDELREGVVAN